jgi:Flp pilus assembly protein TadG
VEVAMLAPVVLLILMIIVDGGRMFFAYLQVSEAARAGAQYGAQSLATSGDITNMKAYAIAAAPNFSITPTATYFCCCPNSSGNSCTNFGNSSGTAPFAESCGVDPLTLVSGACPNWRKYEQVTASATFNTLVTYPGIPHSLAFTTKSLMRSK